MTEQMKCPKCNGEMDEGMIPEAHNMGTVLSSVWAKKLSFMKGLENKHSIISYRCTSCGYLENYAK